MNRISRRTVLRGAAAASAAFPLFTIAGTKASGKVIGANDTIRLGVAGINGRGGAHISEFTGMGEKVRVTYLIDPDSRLFDSRAKAVMDRQAGLRPNTVQDIRQALDDKELDAVTVATCNHWHSLITIWACQAGKDVYVEKPISHNVFEGRKCVEAAKKYNRVVQHGTQSRSSPGWAKTIAAVYSGKYGKLLVSKGEASKNRWSIGFKPEVTPPATFDFNLWLGPAPDQPFHGNLHPYNWHWFWDFGNGDIGNQGVHQMDIARWGIQGGTLPTKVYSLGGRFLPDGPDQGQVPNQQLAVLEFGPVTLLFEVRGLTGRDKQWPNVVTNEFYTTDGVIKEGGTFHPKDGGKAQKVEVDELPIAPGGAFGSFINAMRTRKPEDCNCDAEVAHFSAALIHLANASYRLGKQGTYDKARGAIGDNKEVVASLERIRDNTKAVGVPIDKTVYTIGPVLTFDPASEKFTGERADEANKLITRQYRPPFIVPESV
ncbi:MAG TPA: Gfo/Idh/MocA family oxidoreductase [Pirellulaceae bacterium]|nr:Gfo/Idh/MocA family oxidoreductase [Pirellulaceae bacterium]